MIPKTLLLSWSVPPAASAIASVTANLARQFSRDDLVILGEPDRGTPAETWLPEWPPIVTLDNPRWVEGRGARYLRKLTLPRLLRRTLQVARSQRVQAIIAIFPSEEYLVAGWLAARRLGIPFYPWLHNAYLDQTRGWQKTLAAWLQPKILRDARHVFVMSEGMLELFHARYPEVREKCSALVHPWAEEAPPFSPPPPVGNNPHFVFIGALNASNFDAAGRLFRAVSTIPGRRLSVLGRNQVDTVRRLGAEGDWVKVAQVSRDELMARVREADVLLLPHGLSGSYSQAEYDTMFPTKTIEYLHSGRPILAHTPPDCFLTRFLRRHECALVVDQADPSAVSSALHDLLTDPARRSELVRKALMTTALFGAERVAGHLRQILGLSSG